MKATVLHAEASYQRQPFKTPLILSTGTITELIEVRAAARVVVEGREATGIGSTYLSDLWAWPTPALSHEHKERALQAACDAIANNLRDFAGGEAAHPIELGLRLHDAVCHRC